MTEQSSIKIALYADVNLNLIDGSTIWLQSVGLCLIGIPNVSLTVISREDITNTIILQPLIDAGVKIHNASALQNSGGNVDKDINGKIASIFKRLELRGDADLFIVRGAAPLKAIAEDKHLAGRTWAYWIKRPDVVSPSADTETRHVIHAFPKIIVQSAFAKAALESLYGAPIGKVLVLPPMVPAEALAIEPQDVDFNRLVYSGKLDRDYLVEEYLDLPSLAERQGSELFVSMVGDKVNRVPDDPQFPSRIKRRLADTGNVVWHGAVSRSRALELMSQAAFGLCVRGSVYDSSIETSTKLLEFCALSVPPILNRTELHEEFLGADYPYFANDLNGILAAVASASADPALYRKWRVRVREKAAEHAMSANAARLQHAFGRTGVLNMATARIGRARRRVLIAGHDLKFLAGVLPRLESDPALEIRYDRWLGARRNDAIRSEGHAAWAETIFCEWCAGAAVWYSNRVRPDQKCFVRLHRFEAFEEDPKKVDFGRVERLIVVSDYFRDHCVQNFGVAADRIDILPQFVDCEELRRDKHAWASHTLGFVGVNGFFHKRVDRAVELLERLRDRDDRWRMRIRSVMPWDISWVWGRPREVQAFRKLFAHIAERPALRHAILFDPPGSDMPEWYRNVSYIVSTSESEGCHTSVAEGMASGAIPLVIDWPGAASVYPAEFVRPTVDGLAELATEHEPGHWTDESRARYADMARQFDVERTRSHLRTLFLS